MSESRQSIFGSTNTQKINIHAIQVLTKPERLPGSPLLSTKKGVIVRWLLFLWRAREENAQHFLFPPPSKPSPGGRLCRFVPKLRGGVWFGGCSFVRAAVCSRLLFGCVVADGRWLAPRGWVRVWCLYMCGRNGGVFRELVPLWRCVFAVGRSAVFVGWIVSPCPCCNGSDLRDLVPLRRLVIARG